MLYVKLLLFNFLASFLVSVLCFFLDYSLHSYRSSKYFNCNRYRFFFANRGDIRNLSLSLFRRRKSDYKERRKDAINWREKSSDNSCYSKVGRARIKWVVIENFPICFMKYWKNKQFHIVHQEFFRFLEARIFFSPTV